jgi:hypothetical protein
MATRPAVWKSSTRLSELKGKVSLNPSPDLPSDTLLQDVHLPTRIQLLSPQPASERSVKCGRHQLPLCSHFKISVSGQLLISAITLAKAEATLWS